ncbi:MAG: hypothetical protein EP305_00075 [Bacteroidetes bacterium]|nr:MAG: hypothetical protein EP305_00075 [Bacteroidota bacterium]
MKDKLLTYLQGSSRNKLVITSEKIPGVHYLDVGETLSLSLANSEPISWNSMKIKSEISKLFAESIEDHAEYGSILSIENIGILLESEVQFDFKHFLEQYSRDMAIFLKWDGDHDESTLFFLSKDKGIKIPLTNLSYIKL